MVWRNNEGSLKGGAEAFTLFLRGVQLVLRYRVLTVLDLDEMDAKLENHEILGRCCLEKMDLLVAAGGAAVQCSRSPSVAPHHS